MVVKNATELIGNTPLLELTNIEKKYGLKAKIFAKMEYFNPAGSIKDRIAMQMIKDAEEAGLVNENTTFIEPTSGNTGIGIASIATAKGYKAIIVMPESMSIERRKTIAAYGATLVLTEASKGMKGAIEKANQLKEEIPNSLILGQFDNPSNPKVHYLTTGPEIYKDLNGKVDIFVAGIGTGGTVTGAGRYLKEQNKNIKVVGVEPESSPVISKGVAGPHMIQGIGAGFIPKTLETSILDEVITISNDDAFIHGRLVGQLEGVLVGISSGAALKAGLELAQREENEGKNIVVIFPDTGDRYLSTKLFGE